MLIAPAHVCLMVHVRIFTNKTLSFLFPLTHICLMAPIQDFYLPLTNLLSTYQGLMQRLFFLFQMMGLILSFEMRGRMNTQTTFAPVYYNMNFWICIWLNRTQYQGCLRLLPKQESGQTQFRQFVFFERSRTQHNQEIPLNQPLKCRAQT